MGLGKTLLKAGNRGHVWLYRRTEGRFGSMGGTLVLIGTTGARSGQLRTNPVMGLRHGEEWIVVASAGGGPKNPGWYHNLIANPEVIVEKGPHRQRMIAREATPEERPGLWAEVVEADPRFARYERKPGRTIPVIILEPAWDEMTPGA